MNPKLGVVLLFLFLTIPPVWVLRSLANIEVPEGAHVAEQPGGVIRGVVRNEAGRALPGIEVRVELVSFSERGRRRGRGGFPGMPGGAGPPGGGGDTISRVEHGVLQSDGAGRFEFDVPPHHGFYGVVAGGPFWQRTNQNVSFFDGEGEARVPGDVVLELAEAGALRVTAVHRPWTHESTVVLRALRDGRARGVAVRRALWDDEVLEIVGLPEGSYQVEIEHPGGTETTHEIEIVAGRFEALEVDLSDV